MKRDMDFVRTLLLYVEAEHVGDDFLDVDIDSFEGVDEADVYGHLVALIDAGFLHDHHQRSDITPLTNGLTWAGHEFLDSVRDPIVWRKTKEVAKQAGGWTASTLAEIAKSIVSGAATAMLTGGV